MNSVIIPELQALSASNTVNNNDLFIVYKINAPSSEKTRKITALKLKEYLANSLSEDLSNSSIFDLYDVVGETNSLSNGSILMFQDGKYIATKDTLQSIIQSNIPESSASLIIVDLYTSLPISPEEGTQAFVLNATDDTTIGKDIWALYLYTTEWVLIAREDSLIFKSSLLSSLAIPTDWQDGVVGLTIANLQGLSFTEATELLFFPTVEARISSDKTVVLSGITAQMYEVNTLISRNLTATFTQGSIQNGDGSLGPSVVGMANRFVFYDPTSTHTDEVTVAANSASTSALPLHTVTLNQNIWSVQVFHDAGTGSYFNNKGIVGNNLDFARTAGVQTDSSNVITGSYVLFWGSVAAIPSTSAEVRALNSAFSTGTSTITLVTGTTNTIFTVILPPGRSISSVIDVTNLNLDLTSDYVNSGTISVNTGGGSGASVTYTKYVLTVGNSYSPSATHVITLI